MFHTAGRNTVGIIQICKSDRYLPRETKRAFSVASCGTITPKMRLAMQK